MAKVSMSTRLPIPADKVWDVVGQFNGLPEWHPAVERSEITEEGGGGKGTLRTLHLADGGSIVERLEKLEAEEHLYSYEILESPLPVKNYHATLKVKPADGGCEVEWSAEFEPADAPEQDAVQTIEGIFDAGLDNLKKMFGG